MDYFTFLLYKISLSTAVIHKPIISGEVIPHTPPHKRRLPSARVAEDKDLVGTNFLLALAHLASWL